MAAGSPEAVSICHCTSCRRAVGATPVAWVIFSVEKFTISGHSLASHASSANVTRTFCRECGTSLTFKIQDSPDTVDITLASFDRPEGFVPERHIWLEDEVIVEKADLPRYGRDPLESEEA